MKTEEKTRWDIFVRWLRSIFEIPELVEDCSFGCRVDDPEEMEVINGLPYCSGCAQRLRQNHPNLQIVK